MEFTRNDALKSMPVGHCPLQTRKQAGELLQDANRQPLR
jgi:hypothetical protein